MKCLTHDIEVNYPCSPACPLYGDCIASFSREAKRRVRTNADRIRAMTDEELAEQLVINVDGLSKKRVYLAAPVGEIYARRDIAEAHVLEWLQQPYKEDET